MDKLKESDLYEPVKKLLIQNGYEVRGEVKNCDIVAKKPQADEMIVVELKRSFNLKLLYQAMDRRTITNHVYVGIFRPKSYRDKNTLRMLSLLKELGIGLITVSDTKARLTEIVLYPNSQKRVNIKRRQYIEKEYNQRTEDRNSGGINKTKIITAYREASILALCHMEVYDTLNTYYLKKFGYMDKVRNALRSNAFGWFEKAGRGTYGMSAKGVDALDAPENQELIDFYRKEVLKCSK